MGQAQPIQQSYGTPYGNQSQSGQASKPLQMPAPAKQSPFSQYNPQQMGNFAQQNMGLPSFQFSATDSFGNAYNNPAALTAQQGAMAQALNAQRSQQIQAGSFGPLNPMAANQQAQGMVQGGWANPFAQPQTNYYPGGAPQVAQPAPRSQNSNAIRALIDRLEADRELEFFQQSLREGAAGPLPPPPPATPAPARPIAEAGPQPNAQPRPTSPQQPGLSYKDWLKAGAPKDPSGERVAWGQVTVPGVDAEGNQVQFGDGGALRVRPGVAQPIPPPSQGTPSYYRGKPLPLPPDGVDFGFVFRSSVDPDEPHQMGQPLQRVPGMAQPIPPPSQGTPYGQPPAPSSGQSLEQVWRRQQTPLAMSKVDWSDPARPVATKRLTAEEEAFLVNKLYGKKIGAAKQGNTRGYNDGKVNFQAAGGTDEDKAEAAQAALEYERQLAARRKRELAEEKERMAALPRPWQPINEMAAWQSGGMKAYKEATIWNWQNDPGLQKTRKKNKGKAGWRDPAYKFNNPWIY